MNAALNGDVSRAKALIAHGADVNETNQYGLNALLFAAGATPQGLPEKGANGNTEILKILLEAGANPSAKSKINGFNALMAAVDNMRADRVELLLRYGANPNLWTTDGRSPLSLAIVRHDLGSVRMLLAHGARVAGLRDSNGFTHLITAVDSIPDYGSVSKRAFGAMRSNPEMLHNAETIVGLMLDGAPDEIDQIAKGGQSALAQAIIKSDVQIVRLLLAHHANPNVRDRSMANATPLILSVREARSEQIAELLVKNGADINAKDDVGHSAAFYARQSRSPRMIEIIEPITSGR
jgi:ankyrin repeat protein